MAGVTVTGQNRSGAKQGRHGTTRWVKLNANGERYTVNGLPGFFVVNLKAEPASRNGAPNFSLVAKWQDDQNRQLNVSPMRAVVHGHSTYVSLNELQGIRGQLKHHLARPVSFGTVGPISVGRDQDTFSKDDRQLHLKTDGVLVKGSSRQHVNGAKSGVQRRKNWALRTPGSQPVSVGPREIFERVRADGLNNSEGRATRDAGQGSAGRRARSYVPDRLNQKIERSKVERNNPSDTLILNRHGFVDRFKNSANEVFSGLAERSSHWLKDKIGGVKGWLKDSLSKIESLSKKSENANFDKSFEDLPKRKQVLGPGFVDSHNADRYELARKTDPEVRAITGRSVLEDSTIRSPVQVGSRKLVLASLLNSNEAPVPARREGTVRILERNIGTMSVREERIYKQLADKLVCKFTGDQKGNALSQATEDSTSFSSLKLKYSPSFIKQVFKDVLREARVQESKLDDLADEFYERRDEKLHTALWHVLDENKKLHDNIASDFMAALNSKVNAQKRKFPETMHGQFSGVTSLKDLKVYYSPSFIKETFREIAQNHNRTVENIDALYDYQGEDLSEAVRLVLDQEHQPS